MKPREPLAVLRRRYFELFVEAGLPLSAAARRDLEQDPRRGARELLARLDRAELQRQQAVARLRELTEFERRLWDAGLRAVAGVDEAGVGPLAGPVVAAAVILPPGFSITGIDDSKKLSERARVRLASEIKKHAIAWAVHAVEPSEIDELNIYWAAIAAMERAVGRLEPPAQHVLVDARTLARVPLPQQAIVHGDARSVSIAAASILAKTARDERMLELEALFPGYGFAQHKGYPVPAHWDALRRLGPCVEHRRSFALAPRR